MGPLGPIGAAVSIFWVFKTGLTWHTCSSSDFMMLCIYFSLTFVLWHLFFDPFPLTTCFCVSGRERTNWTYGTIWKGWNWRKHIYIPYSIFYIHIVYCIFYILYFIFYILYSIFYIPYSYSRFYILSYSILIITVLCSFSSNYSFENHCNNDYSKLNMLMKSLHYSLHRDLKEILAPQGHKEIKAPWYVPPC